MARRIAEALKKAGLSGLLFCLMTGAALADALTLEVADARFALDRGQPIVTITLTPAAREAFARFTAANVGRKVEIRFEGKTILTPVVREPITGGVMQITGPGFTDAPDATRRLAAGGARIEIELSAD